MRPHISILLLFVAVALCRDFGQYYIVLNSISWPMNKAKINGSAIVKKFAVGLPVTVAGTFYGGNATENGIASFSGKIVSVSSRSNTTRISANYTEGSWNGKALPKLEGTISMRLSDKNLEYQVWCQNEAGAQFIVNGTAHESSWLPFAVFARYKARYVVGAKLSAVETVNAAVFAHPFFTYVKNCSWYMTNFKDSSDQYNRCLLVGNDGKHCGVVDYTGSWFVHSDPKKGVVVRTPLAQAAHYFKNGFKYKECAYAN